MEAGFSKKGKCTAVRFNGYIETDERRGKGVRTKCGHAYETSHAFLYCTRSIIFSFYSSYIYLSSQELVSGSSHAELHTHYAIPAFPT